jgi:hypothetical protein
VAGTLSLGAGGAFDPAQECRDKALLIDQVVTSIGPQRKFYSWTTQEQIAELRAGTELFSRSERAGEGRGLLFVSLEALAASGSDPMAVLAGALVNDVFAKARYAWTNPWATLLGFPGESYGDQLLQIELRPEAWIARMENGQLSVVDAEGTPVSLEQALATPERIGAIFHAAPGDDSKVHCGTFSQGAVGYREFALGNSSMVARWSLATPEIAERLQSDAQTLRALADELDGQYVPVDWSQTASCDWGNGYYCAGGLHDYDLSVCLPSELYRPSPENLEALVAALEAIAPTGEPLVVTPGT